MTGRTERNLLSLHGRRGLACISPWSFPLAIFLGQVSAALVGGNGVIADLGDLATDVRPVIDAEAQRRL